MIKAIFFDIDGTLLSHQTKQISPLTKQALHLLKEKGIYTFIATGRHISEFKDLPLDDLEFEGYITLNGQYCYNNENVIYDMPIPQHDINQVIQEIKANPVPCVFVEKDIMYINYINEVVKDVQNSISSSLPHLGPIERGYVHPIYQVMPYDIDNNDAKRILQCMPHCKATWWHERAIDIIPSSGGKQTGIRKVLDYYHLSQDETMAFGDGENDIEMFQFVKIAVAMGNAAPEVQKMADIVTDDVDHDGIYNLLHNMNII